MNPTILWTLASLVACSISVGACTPGTAEDGEVSSLRRHDASVSAAGTAIPPASSIVDTNLHVWTVVNGVVFEDDAAAGYSANVVLLYFDGNSVYQENAAGGWWMWTGSDWSATASPIPGSAPPPPTVAAPLSLSCQDATKLYAGSYAVENNQWGSAGVVGAYSQCVGMGSIAADGSVSARWTWTWPSGPSEVKGYPAIIYGQKPGTVATPSSGLPKRLDLLNTARTNWQSQSTHTGTGQLTYDLWLTSDAQSHASFLDTPITHEIMLAVEPYGGYGLDRNPAWFIEQIDINGVTFKVYKADNFGPPGHTWRFLVFQMLTPTVSGSIDWRPLFAYLKSKNFISGAEYLSSIEFGTEINEGTGDVAIESFSATVN